MTGIGSAAPRVDITPGVHALFARPGRPAINRHSAEEARIVAKPKKAPGIDDQQSRGAEDENRKEVRAHGDTVDEVRLLADTILFMTS